MSEKCSKYESLFIFGSTEDFNEHVKSCPDCQREHEKMEKVSDLVKEVAPFIKDTRKIAVSKQFNSKIYLKAAAGFVILFLSFSVIYFNQPHLEKNYVACMEAKSAQEADVIIKDKSIIAQMGLPIDEYGLLAVEELVND